ncbi:MAG: FG-GAP repeat protein [Chloroflexi bacterium]|nr:FG-GAP repeat protein [Chloroflexota bacterium]
MSVLIVARVFRISLALGFVFLAALALPDTTEAASFNEVKKLLASDAEAQDRFGLSVAVSGDIAIAGAFTEDAGGDSAGAAYIFQSDKGGADNWGEVKKLTASDAEALDRFGNTVAVSGDTAIVGAAFEGDLETGAAYIFQRDQGGVDNWGEVKKLTASDPEAFDNFGNDVAISGDIVIAGASREDAGGGGAGAAYVFHRDQGGANNWGQVTKLTASDAQAGDNFGRTVAIAGGSAVVAANFEDEGGASAGAAYVFERDQGGPNNWGEVTKLIASDSQANAILGHVAISGDTIMIGSPGRVGSLGSAGAVYVFERDEGGLGNWGEVKKLTASDAQLDDSLGYETAIDGDTAIVGARREDAAGNGAGAAYVFERDQGGPNNWGQVKKLTASDAQALDTFGIGVAVSGQTAIVGAHLESEAGANAGAAYVFEAQNTPTGTDVEVAVGSGVTVTFPTVTTAGDTTVTTSTAGPPPPTGFRIVGTGQPVYYDINTSASFTGTATVCIEYEEPPGNQGNLKLQKFNPPFKDITQSVDTDNNIICGKTTSFSIFAITEPLPPDPVGGFALDADAGLRPLESPASSSHSFGVLAWAFAVASLVTLGCAAWYTRRRLA